MKKSVLFFLIACSSCFGAVDQAGSVSGYKNGVVITRGGSFAVGTLPATTWTRKNFSYKTIVFSNVSGEASISVDAFCKGSFDDGPLTSLADQLTYNIATRNPRSQKVFQLDGREALRTVVDGKVDGVSIVLDTVVLKANECVFDFVYTSHPAFYSEGIKDFEVFFKGFHYINGPSIN